MPESLETRDRRRAALPSGGFEPPTLWGLLRRHKRATAAVVASLLALAAIVVVSDLGSRVSRISDSTACSVWGTAPQTLRNAYAALYVREHGPLRGGVSGSGAIEGAIDFGCQEAYGFDESDTVTVLQSIRHQY